MNRRILNIILRAATVGGRFVLLIALAKLLSPADVGVFGLMVSVILLSILLVSLDFRKYAHRELLARDKKDWNFVFSNQFIVQLVLYLLFTPFLIILFYVGIIDWQYLIWFFLLHLTVYIATELEQLLVVLHEQVSASIVFFLQTASWSFMVMPVMYYETNIRSLETVFIFWIGGNILSIIYALFKLRSMSIKLEFQPFSKDWIYYGLKVGSLFFLSSLFLKLLLTMDRLTLEAMGTPDQLGVYVLFLSIVIGAFNFIDPAIYAFIYPSMLRSRQTSDILEYKKKYKELILSASLVSVVIGIVLYVAFPILVRWLANPIYEQGLEYLPFFIFAGLFFILSYIPHYDLYSKGKVKQIMYAHLYSAICFPLIFYALSLDSHLNGVVVSIMTSMFVLLISKLIYSLK